jgi:hypothetical protein
MKLECEPITDDEWLLRRVWHDRFCTSKVPIISRGAFEPRIKGRDPDTTGISLYRSACLSTADEILELIPEDKRDATGIVRIRVGELKALGLSVRPEPSQQIAGHVIIPELNATDYQKNKPVLAAVGLRLAEIASKGILREPKPPEDLAAVVS